ncbi:hypothetical protein E2562_021917 [Oryza meyeriana var. granulata]|uniref:Uncharacterized protein n=1 Tax=Oryza meyeriana var. granulata TaxID=110450 RepID=A0A6G1C8S1_9ORYZ|nr:hypothetical protein E2562_021917 [Oryza meyeriana var. granulata]
MRSALAAEEVHLQEGCQQLESLVRPAKVVYDCDVAEVEREHSTLDVKRVEAVAEREKDKKALRELEGRWDAITILKAWAEECELELAHCKAVVTKWEEAAA